MQLPGYEILGELGRGGMGVVYKARHVPLNRLVALKMILAGSHASSDGLARFRIEAQATAGLDHPNIVRVHDFGEHDGLPYFSMEFVPGSSLLGRMTGAPWFPDAAAYLIRTLALAVHHAHQQSVIHRDLKPANVLVRDDGTPKISDFGLAKQLDDSADLTGSGRILGTARYMAPEQASGNSKAVGPASDVHALGAILYELLTGRPAFEGRTLLEVLDQVRWNEPTPPTRLRPEIPAALEAACLRCLRKQPSDRYATAEELADSLGRCVGAGPTRDSSSPPPAPPTPGTVGRDQWWRA